MASGRGRQKHRPREEPEQVLFCEDPPEVGSRARLTGPEADHARRSLRLRSGDPIWLVDGQGGRYSGRVTDLGKHSLDVQVETRESIPVWPGRILWLAAGVLRSQRMDYLVEKASELGVVRFVPLLLSRCVAKPHEDGAKQERWNRLAIESLKQCRRSRLMEVAPPRTLEDFLESLPSDRGLWMAEPQGEDPRKAASPQADRPLVLVVGPEGGISPEETRLLEGAGCVSVSLGGHRLRAETAVLTLLASALACLGDLSPGSSSR